MPTALLATVGKKEIWRSLGTDSLTVARRRAHQVAATIEVEFEAARARIGLPTDPAILIEAEARQARIGERPLPLHSGVGVHTDAVGPTIREVYESYMADPTRDWSPRTRQAYETSKTLAMAIFGEDTPIRAITRAHCRELIEVARWLPRHASKLYPRLSAREIAFKAKAEQRGDLISAANLNAYLNKLCGLFNWAMKEQLIDRNPAVGLKVPDPVLRREKRLPYSAAQLRSIFSAPLYVGCQDDGHGYAKPGPNRPRNARFWIPLVALFAGLRLNEICQLDSADVRMIEGVACFVITASGEADKRLKTASSERLVPVHPDLLGLGLLDFVALRKRQGEVKLFSEIEMGATGYRSSTFSAWFTRFSRKAGAAAPKTCFHSFRHVFRDALREARIDRDIALTLGGWSRPGGSGSSASVSDAYGSGYRISTLFEAISRVRYPDLDLSQLQA